MTIKKNTDSTIQNLKFGSSIINKDKDLVGKLSEKFKTSSPDYDCFVLSEQLEEHPIEKFALDGLEDVFNTDNIIHNYDFSEEFDDNERKDGKIEITSEQFQEFMEDFQEVLKLSKVQEQKISNVKDEKKKSKLINSFISSFNRLHPNCPMPFVIKQ